MSKRTFKNKLFSQLALVLLGAFLVENSAAAQLAERCADNFGTKYERRLFKYQSFGAELRTTKVLGNFNLSFRDQIPNNWNGKTYVFTPGLSKSSLFFEPLVEPLLAAGFRVIRFDPFNIGGTLTANLAPMKSANLEFDAEAQAEAIKSLKLSPGSIFLVGHSRGAAVALITAKLLGPNYIARIDMADPYVRWLADAYRQQTSETIAANTRLLNFFNPLMYWPGTKSAFEMTTRMWSDAWAKFGIDAVMGASNFEDLVRKEIANRPASENTGLDPEVEIAGIMAQYNAMKGASILDVASAASQQGVQVGVWTAKDDPLVPEIVLREIEAQLNLNPNSSNLKIVDGGHNSPIEKPREFLAWLLRP